MRPVFSTRGASPNQVALIRFNWWLKLVFPEGWATPTLAKLEPAKYPAILVPFGDCLHIFHRKNSAGAFIMAL